MSLEELEGLAAQLGREVYHHRREWDKTALLDAMEAAIPASAALSL